MSFSKNNFSLELHPSLLHGVILALAHILAFAALAMNSIFVDLMAGALMFAVLVSMVYCSHRFIFLSHPESVLEISYYRGDWRLLTRSGEQVEAELLMPHYVSHFFIVLRFRSRRKRFPVVITRNSVGPDEFRRSRVFFRYALSVNED